MTAHRVAVRDVCQCLESAGGYHLRRNRVRRLLAVTTTLTDSSRTSLIAPSSFQSAHLLPLKSLGGIWGYGGLWNWFCFFIHFRELFALACSFQLSYVVTVWNDLFHLCLHYPTQPKDINNFPSRTAPRPIQS